MQCCMNIKYINSKKCKFKMPPWSHRIVAPPHHLGYAIRHWLVARVREKCLFFCLNTVDPPNQLLTRPYWVNMGVLAQENSYGFIIKKKVTMRQSKLVSPDLSETSIHQSQIFLLSVIRLWAFLKKKKKGACSVPRHFGFCNLFWMCP